MGNTAKADNGPLGRIRHGFKVRFVMLVYAIAALFGWWTAYLICQWSSWGLARSSWITNCQPTDLPP